MESPIRPFRFHSASGSRPEPIRKIPFPRAFSGNRTRAGAGPRPPDKKGNSRPSL